MNETQQKIDRQVTNIPRYSVKEHEEPCRTEVLELNAVSIN